MFGIRFFFLKVYFTCFKPSWPLFTENKKIKQESFSSSNHLPHIFWCES